MLIEDFPFNDSFREAMLSEKKTCTSRNQRYGDTGDTFKRFSATFRILCVVELPLSIVANYFYEHEGCNSPREFMDIWAKLHPRRGWTPSDMVYVHFFMRVE